MFVLSVQYSCAVVSVFLFGGKANLVLLTPIYSTLLALTDGRTDGRRNEFILVVLATLTGFLQVNHGWAGHPDGFLQVNLDVLMPLPSPSLENLPTINIQALLLKSKNTAMSWYTLSPKKPSLITES